MGADGSGNHLRVDPAVVPALRDAFADAMAKVDRQITLAGNDLRIARWANDPVSADATQAFNDRALDAAESALSTLRAYRTDLSTAIDALGRTAARYQSSDEDNSVTVGKEEGTGD